MFRKICGTGGFANSLGVLAWLASFIIPALLISNKQRFLGSQLLASILPNMCLYWGFHTIANWEARSKDEIFGDVHKRLCLMLNNCSCGSTLEDNDRIPEHRRIFQYGPDHGRTNF